MANRLYRSRRDRMLAGVAGGLAEMWGADPSLVRIVWALLVVFTGGVALLVYIVMAIVIPEEEEVFGPDGAPVTVGEPRGERAGGTSAGVLFGAFLVILGGFFLIREFFPRIDFDWFWPLVLVAAGILLIGLATGRAPRFGGRSPAAPAPPPAPADAIAPPPATTGTEPETPPPTSVDRPPGGTP